MRNMRLVVGAIVVGLLIGVSASSGAVLIQAFDFTGGGSAWTVNVHEANGLPIVYELGANPTKVGYDDTLPGVGSEPGYATLWQQVTLPAGQTMSNLRLEAKVSGYSSWVVLGRIGLSTTATNYATQGTLWTGTDHLPSGVVYTDADVSIDASSTAALTDISSVWVGAEIASYYGTGVIGSVSEIKLYGDIVPEPATMGLLMCGGLLVGCLRKR
jgi:hypothetical protein